MKNTLEQIVTYVLLLVFLFPATIHSSSKKICPDTSCSFNSFYQYLPVKYPFKLDTDHSPKHCQDYFALKCNYIGDTILNLPSYGDFSVDQIGYSSQSIILADPNQCLPKRLMTNLSLAPFKAHYTNYTFYTCPRIPIERAKIPNIQCMSNSSSVTIAIANSYSDSLPKYLGCETLVRLLLPIPPMNSTLFMVISDVLVLTWNVTDCEDCFSIDENSTSRGRKFISNPVVIPAVVVLVAFFGLSIMIRLLKLTAGRHSSTEPGDNTIYTNRTNRESTTTTGATSAAPNEANGRVDHSPKVNKPCSELIVVDDTHGTSLPDTETSCCPICLESYREKDTVRYLSQCGHYFHAQCVDQWLHKNTTCPVCRDKLSGSIL